MVTDPQGGTIEFAALQLTEMSLDRMAGRVVARGHLAQGSTVDFVSLSYGQRRAPTAPASTGDNAGAWSISLYLGPPVVGLVLVHLVSSGDDTSAGTWQVPIADLRDATHYQCNISAASFCRVTGRFECRGWGSPAPGSLSLLINGRAVAHSARRYVRTDVTERYPWTRGIATGWALSGRADFPCTVLLRRRHLWPS